MAVLVELLGNNFGRHTGVEKPVAYDLAHNLICSAVVPFRSCFSAFKSFGPIGHKLIEDLVITLPGIPKLLCGLGRAKSFTPALDEHRELESDFIIFPDGKRSFRTGQKWEIIMELDHMLPPLQAKGTYAFEEG